MLSKFYGIRFISGYDGKRMTSVVKLILFMAGGITAVCHCAPPYSIVFLLLNGFPLGMMGLVFSYMWKEEKATEFMGAVLAISFIFSSG